ncbi:hypothetical protein ACFRMQ_06245 [Kitasatospora sp. NPDC056783]|uniref:hypothetical protein n=1 Tax=Kitasatospora sp. NPDC056783 TaxID=3345943 RepID=UPI0036CBC3BE
MKRIQFGDVPLADYCYFTIQTYGNSFIGIDLVEDGPFGPKHGLANISVEEARKLRRELKKAIHRIEENA